MQETVYRYKKYKVNIFFPARNSREMAAPSRGVYWRSRGARHAAARVYVPGAPAQHLHVRLLRFLVLGRVCKENLVLKHSISRCYLL